MKKSRICPIWGPSDPLWSQTYHPWWAVFTYQGLWSWRSPTCPRVLFHMAHISPHAVGVWLAWLARSSRLWLTVGVWLAWLDPSSRLWLIYLLALSQTFHLFIPQSKSHSLTWNRVLQSNTQKHKYFFLLDLELRCQFWPTCEKRVFFIG